VVLVFEVIHCFELSQYPMGLNISQITIAIFVRLRFMRWDKNTVATIGGLGTGMDNETVGPFLTYGGSG
jgi:hypothetical protein